MHKSQTLKKRSDFLKISKYGKYSVTPTIVVQCMTIDNSFTQNKVNNNFDYKGVTFVGYTATKKIGNAIIRTYAKRRMRSLTNKILTQYKIEGVSFVLIARKKINNVDFETIEKDFRKALKFLKIKKL